MPLQQRVAALEDAEPGEPAVVLQNDAGAWEPITTISSVWYPADESREYRPDAAQSAAIRSAWQIGNRLLLENGRTNYTSAAQVAEITRDTFFGRAVDFPHSTFGILNNAQAPTMRIPSSGLVTLPYLHNETNSWRFRVFRWVPATVEAGAELVSVGEFSQADPVPHRFYATGFTGWEDKSLLYVSVGRESQSSLDFHTEVVFVAHLLTRQPSTAGTPVPQSGANNIAIFFRFPDRSSGGAGFDRVALGRTATGELLMATTTDSNEDFDAARFTAL